MINLLKTILLFLFSLIFTPQLFSQSELPLQYYLSIQADDPKVTVRIVLPEAVEGPIRLVIPRSAPGTYEITPYSRFVEGVAGTTNMGAFFPAEKGVGSYYDLITVNSPIQSISYLVDIKRMEDELEGWASSKKRDNYLGILGYSVFGLVEGMEEHPIELTIETSHDWPIFSTLQPTMERPRAEATFPVNNYAELADAQYLMGEGLQLLKVEEADIPFFAAVYSEAEVNMKAVGQMGQLALEKLDDYFGFTPMPHYTMVYEFLNPRTPQHTYNFSIEHKNSMTATFASSEAIQVFKPQDRRLRSLIHHIGHSWIPLRAYGEGYRPFAWQVAPLIETIWLHEGFIWYVLYEVTGTEALINYFRQNVDDAPDFIKRLSLKEISFLASTQYSSDFRIGRNVFSRGALLAYDLDQLITEKTNGEKSFKDVLLNLYRWAEKNQKAFPYEELPDIMGEGLGVDLSGVWAKWGGG